MRDLHINAPDVLGLKGRENYITLRLGYTNIDAGYDHDKLFYAGTGVV